MTCCLLVKESGAHITIECLATQFSEQKNFGNNVLKGTCLVKEAKDFMSVKRIISIGSLVAGAMFLPSIVQGQASSLVINENSSTSLTATLDGVSQSVINESPNNWFIELTTVDGNQQFWTEPGEQGVLNLVQPQFGNGIVVVSDLVSGASSLGNGVTDTTSFTINGLELDVTYNDNGDGPSVPDTASTLPLLSLSLAALGIFAKRRTVAKAV
jgi:hypothetical protein